MTTHDKFSLNGKTALVTGGYGHLGKGMVMGLASAGANTIVCGKDLSKYRQAFNAFRSSNISFETMDIASSTSIKHSFNTIWKKHKDIDILVNNAMYVDGRFPENLTDDEWNYSIDGTLNSVFRCIREVIPYMKKNKKGSIVNISSMYGIVSPDFRIYKANPEFLNPPHYGAAKAGVIQLTRYYAVFLAKYNIRVNCISPGPFPSQKTQKHKHFIKELASKNPLGRIGQPDDLVGPLLLLASDASSFITGQNIIVDGGWTIW